MIGFLHTAQQHVATFEGLLAQQSPATSRKHMVREDLLEHIRTRGDTPELQAHVQGALQSLDASSEVIMCTCSSLGALAENLELSIPVLRIDRALAEAAIKQGKKILVLATLASTLGPTSSLFFEVNHHHQASIDIKLCENAWQAFARGDSETYAKRIANAAQGYCQEGAYDVIALAQASMAVTLDQPHFPDVPTLTSPPLGVTAALDYLKHKTDYLKKESSC